MEITGATNGLPLHVWAKHKKTEELLQNEWLKKTAEEMPAEDLAGYNPTINVILLLIIETKGNTTNQRDELLTRYKEQLRKEKIFALISKDEKENKQKHLSN